MDEAQEALALARAVYNAVLLRLPAEVRLSRGWIGELAFSAEMTAR